jgi:hypothetical protein
MKPPSDNLQKRSCTTAFGNRARAWKVCRETQEKDITSGYSGAQQQRCVGKKGLDSNFFAMRERRAHESACNDQTEPLD